MTDQFAYPPDREEASAKKVAALEALLIEKGVITPQTVDKVLAYFETEMTPLNGKKIVVKAWTDPEFAERIVVDTPAAVAELVMTFFFLIVILGATDRGSPQGVAPIAISFGINHRALSFLLSGVCAAYAGIAGVFIALVGFLAGTVFTALQRLPLGSRLLTLADRLRKRVVGQDGAVEVVAEAVLRYHRFSDLSPSLLTFR